MRNSSGISHFRLRLIKILDATLGYWLCWIFGYLHYLHNPGSVTTPANQPKRILVIRPGGMGDMILLIPVLRHIAQCFPAARLDIICEKRNIEVLRLAGLEDNAHAYDAGMLNVLRLLRTGQYDIALDTEQFHNFSAIIALLSRAPARIGFKINPQRNLLYTHLVNYDPAGYEGAQFMRLLKPAGCSDISYKLEGSISTAGTNIPTQTADKLAGLTKAGMFATIYPGSTSIYKQWAPANFTVLIQALTTTRSCPVVLLGDRNDAEQAEEILKATGGNNGNIISLAGQLKLNETAEVIRRSNLFISGDAGLAHLAIAVGTPTVVIFGPTDPDKWGQMDARHKIAKKTLACSPCFIFGYHKLCRSIDCMAGISVEEVLALCDDLLQGRGQGDIKK